MYATILPAANKAFNFVSLARETATHSLVHGCNKHTAGSYVVMKSMVCGGIPAENQAQPKSRKTETRSNPDIASFLWNKVLKTIKTEKLY